MQTSDNNIVHVDFVVQYRIKDAFESRYRVASPREILRDAAQAAVREVVGRTRSTACCARSAGIVQSESEQSLQESLDRYESGLEVVGIELQDVQPPEAVRAAFDDVLAATQDRNRAVNEAEGYANEVLPRARAEADEAIESARSATATPRSPRPAARRPRFPAIASEYQKAPEVTRTRLYLETMEEVLPEGARR